MKNWFWTLIITTILLSACKDTTAPVFVSFKINGQEINLASPSFSASVNDLATFQIITGDDEDLLQLIAYIDTTGLDNRERLYADGLEGVEEFTEFTMTMRSIDSLSQKYFFGEATPVTFTVSDNNQNTESVTIPMTAI